MSEEQAQKLGQITTVGAFEEAAKNIKAIVRFAKRIGQDRYWITPDGLVYTEKPADPIEPFYKRFIGYMDGENPVFVVEASNRLGREVTVSPVAKAAKPKPA